MSKVSVEIPEIGTVFLTKKRGQKSIRLRVDAKGNIQVSMPWLTLRSQAINFVVSKKDWILEQKSETAFLPYNGMLFGKTMQLVIRENSSNTRSKQDGKHLIIHFSEKFDPHNPEHRQKVEKAMMKALRTEAEKFLLPRLREFSENYNLPYKSSAIKHVIGRWGSCDSNKHIILSIFLAQLPIELIDYVLVHELVHTKHMNHSSSFWHDVSIIYPEYKLARKKMKTLRPKIYDAKTFMS